MAVLLPNFKKAIIEDLLAGISSNTARYYAFASSPIPHGATIPDDDLGDKTTSAYANWTMLFGKKINSNDMIAVVNNIVWTTNTTYAKYDDQADLSNSNFYAVVTAGGGADYLVYKCINNNGNTPSTITPPTSSPLYVTVTLNDGYMWRYLYSISATNFNKFVPTSNSHIPVTPNSSIVANAGLNSSLDVINIDAGGNGYITYHTGSLATVSNSTYMQIANTADGTPDYYAGCSVYVYNTVGSPAGQLLDVYNSTAIGAQRWLTTSPANVAAINATSAAYIICPKVVIDSDGKTIPSAYCTVNSTFKNINSVVIVETGSYISRANAYISVANNFGSGAVIRPIVPPPGGHGSDPATELFCRGIGMRFQFANSEGNTIPANVSYNKIGIVKNPYALNANNTKGSAFSSNTFSQVLKANVSPSTTFVNAAAIVGNTSGANGLVAFSNSSVVYIVGDKDFSNGELVISANSSANITITSLGDIYTKDLNALYVQNLDDITRTSSQTETYKVIIKI